MSLFRAILVVQLFSGIQVFLEDEAETHTTRSSESSEDRYYAPKTDELTWIRFTGPKINFLPISIFEPSIISERIVEDWAKRRFESSGTKKSINCKERSTVSETSWVETTLDERSGESCCAGLCKDQAGSGDADDSGRLRPILERLLSTFVSTFSCVPRFPRWLYDELEQGRRYREDLGCRIYKDQTGVQVSWNDCGCYHDPPRCGYHREEVHDHDPVPQSSTLRNKKLERVKKNSSFFKNSSRQSLFAVAQNPWYPMKIKMSVVDVATCNGGQSCLLENEEFTLPFAVPAPGYYAFSFCVDWGDGSSMQCFTGASTSGQSGSPASWSHTYCLYYWIQSINTSRQPLREDAL